MPARHTHHATAAVLVLGLAACGSSTSSTVTTQPSVPASTTASTSIPAPASAGIVIHDFAFKTSPVAPGASVTVKNNDNETHSVSADGGSFNVTVPAGSTMSFAAPSKPGTYAFHCNFHAQMHGTLTVRAGA